MEHGLYMSQNQSISKFRNKKNDKCYQYGKKENYKMEYWHLEKNKETKGKGHESSKLRVV